MNPVISVIMPIYNAEFYLEDALNSIVNQTIIDDIEVLMVDDGSTDNSPYIIEKYDLKYDNFQAFHKKNEGPGLSRNYGLNFAKGNYIHFMDSDDFLLYDALEKMYSHALNDDYDVITANFYKFSEYNTWYHIIGDYVFNSLDENLFNVNLEKYPNLIWDMTMGNKIYKKKFLDENNIRFYEGEVIFEDNIFSNEVYIKSNNVAVLKDVVYCWRHREPNTSRSQHHDIERGKKLYKMAIIVNDLLINNIDDKDILNRKYLKWLTVDVPFYMSRFKSYSKQNYVDFFEGAYNLVNFVPEEYFKDLSTYYKVLYKMLKNKDWDDLSELLLLDLKNNPNKQINIDSKYYSEFNFENDAKNEVFSSNVTKITNDDENIIFKVENYIPFNGNIWNDELEFIIKNPNFEDIVLDSEYFKDNILKIPVNLINFGENTILVKFNSNFEKETLLNTVAKGSFIFDDFDIDVKRDINVFLKLIKREKNDMKLIIDDVKVNRDKLELFGNSNKKLNSLILTDDLGLKKFEYSLNYISDNDFSICIDYNDFLKFPVKKFELKPNEKFGSINLSKSFKFYDENYMIDIINNKNKIKINFKLYDNINELNKLKNKVISLEKKNKKLKKKNKKFKNELNSFKSNNLVGKLKRIF